MDFDLIVRNATLPDGRKRQDVAVAAGRIAAIEPQIGAQARQTIDARGYLLSPPFVDCHFHMDATLSLGQPRMNVSGTLARRDRAVGRTEASTDAGSRRRTRAALLRSCRVARPARRAQPRRRLRRPPACRRGPARRESEGEALSRSCSSSPSRRTAISVRRPRRGISIARSISASTSSAAFRISSARWLMAPRRVQGPVRNRRETRADGRPALRRKRRPAFPPH